MMFFMLLVAGESLGSVLLFALSCFLILVVFFLSRLVKLGDCDLVGDVGVDFHPGNTPLNEYWLLLLLTVSFMHNERMSFSSACLNIVSSKNDISAESLLFSCMAISTLECKGD